MPGAFRERVDMAVFGPLPDYARASIRLCGVEGGRAAAPAAALLARAGRSAAALTARDPRLRAWYLAYASVGLNAEVLPPPEILAAWAGLPGGVPSQSPLVDLVNAFALLHVLPAAAYDLAGITGDLWLCPSRGCERFDALGDAPTASPDFNEVILVDSAETVLARHWHGAQSRSAAAGAGARDVLVHLDFLPPLAERAAELADAFVRLATGFVGGTAELRWLTWETPLIRWTAAPDEGR